MAFTSAKQIMDYLLDLSTSGNYVFRGYSVQEQMNPGLIRYRKNLASRETDLLREFEYYGSRFYSVNTAFDFLSTAQHFGLPTRLVDYTYNPFIALAFALNSPKIGKNCTYENKDDEFIYYIRVCSTKDYPVFTSAVFDRLVEDGAIPANSPEVQCRNVLRFLSKVGEERLGKILLDDAGRRCKPLTHQTAKELAHKIKTQSAVLLIDANRSNIRISNQEGLFMLPLSLDANEYQNTINRCTSVIAINEYFRTDLLKQLEVLGYTSYRLMPDLVSVCGTISTNARYQQANSLMMNVNIKRMIASLKDKDIVDILSFVDNGYKSHLPQYLENKLKGCGVLENSNKICKEFVNLIYGLCHSAEISKASGQHGITVCVNKRKQGGIRSPKRSSNSAKCSNTK